MSVTFGITLDDETWSRSGLEHPSSQNLPLPGVWETLEAIAEQQGLTKLSHFVVEDAEIYDEALEALEELAEQEQEGLRQAMQKKLDGIAEQREWFDASDAGIARTTMQGLIEHLRTHPDLFAQYGDGAGTAIMAELEGFARVLGQIESENIRFKFWME